MVNETILGANKHYHFFTCILGLYGKPWPNFIRMIGNNVTTNKALSKKLNLPLLAALSIVKNWPRLVFWSKKGVLFRRSISSS